MTIELINIEELANLDPNEGEERTTQFICLFVPSAKAVEDLPHGEYPEFYKYCLSNHVFERMHSHRYSRGVPSDGKPDPDDQLRFPLDERQILVFCEEDADFDVLTREYPSVLAASQIVGQIISESECLQEYQYAVCMFVKTETEVFFADILRTGIQTHSFLLATP